MQKQTTINAETAEIAEDFSSAGSARSALTVVTAIAIQQPDSPIIVNITPPPKGDPTGLADVLIGALGLSGVLILAGLLLGVIFASALFWWRSRVGLDVNPEETRDQHIL